MADREIQLMSYGQLGTHPYERVDAARNSRTEPEGISSGAGQTRGVLTMNRHIKYSIVVPLYNEAANVTALYVRLTQVMEGLDEPYEIVFVDDGSADQTPKTLYEIYESDSRVKSCHAAPELWPNPGAEGRLRCGARRYHHLHGWRPAARPGRDPLVRGEN